MATNPSTYIPINCEFHDLLESLATTGMLAKINFRDAEGAVHSRTAVIADVFAKDGVEYLLMSTGETLRLDRLLNVDGESLVDYRP